MKEPCGNKVRNGQKLILSTFFILRLGQDSGRRDAPLSCKTDIKYPQISGRSYVLLSSRCQLSFNIIIHLPIEITQPGDFSETYHRS